MNAEELLLHADRFLAHSLQALCSPASPWSQEGRALADQLRSAAIEMAQSRATEFSPLIPRLHLRAAQVALAHYGSQSPDFITFENDILHYEAYESTRPLVMEYRAFKRDWMGSHSS